MVGATEPGNNVITIVLPEAITIWLLNSILIVGFSIVYRRVQLGSQITLIKRICLYLILANLGGIIWGILYYSNSSKSYN